MKTKKKLSLSFVIWTVALAVAVGAMSDASVAAFFTSSGSVRPVDGASPSVQPADTATRVMVKKTDYPTGDAPVETSMDLANPDNLKQDVGEYDEKTGYYRVGTKLGDNYLSAPYLMTPEEYMRWNSRKVMNEYFRQRNDSLFTRKGKDEFDFTDMHFDLGPAEKIFGPGGVRIKTQGSAELKMGVNYQFTDNPSLAERNRKTTDFDFDEKININVNASIGDKMSFSLGYNTDASFDFDSKNLKLSYEGKEDEIVKLLEAGNVTFPSNNSLVRGAQSLFGIRTDLQFGKLNLQTVVSQKKSKSTSVSSTGGAQLSSFEIEACNYDENTHFFLSQYFRDTYNQACSTLPTITSGINITRIEIWVTNTSGATENTRDIIGFVDLGESSKISNDKWTGMGQAFPQNSSNNLYSSMTGDYSAARNIDQASTVLEANGLTGGVDFEKVENARLLSSSEYTLNSYLGYVSLSSALRTNSVLAVAFEYTYGGNTYQVGEFSSNIIDNDQALFVKLLKNTSNSPKMGNWDLMMKNVYSLNAQSLQKEKFRLDVKYLSDTTGVYLSYIPEDNFKNTTLLKMMNLDRLDDNQKTNPNGRYDYIDGYTVLASKGKVIFPVVEPFGDWLATKLADETLVDKYCYFELYDSTKTVAKQIAEKNKFMLTGEYKGSSGSQIYLGQDYIPQGSVVVTAGGVTLTEGSDYTVDYSTGYVTIINQSIIDAGTNVSVSMESQEAYSLMRKTMLGVNWTYDFSKNFQLGGTYMRLTEQPQTTKVTMGSEPLNNTLWGLSVNWKQNSQWLTNMIDKLPLIEASQPSSINFTGEFAQLIAGKAKGVQSNASYLDDFEETKRAYDYSTPSAWMLSSTPADMEYGTLSDSVLYGYNRARLAWYTIDPLFTRRSSSLTPAHIKSDLNQLSNHYVREVYVREVYPNRDVNQGESNTLSILNLAYYPNERGPYNLDPDVDNDGHLNDPGKRWGGMMRKIDVSDFETSNIQYVEFWLLDPFVYSSQRNDGKRYGGDLVLNLGDISEDVLKDGKKFYESGLPVSDASSVSYTTWGKVPNEKSVVYSFSTESGARQKQDVGLNGLSSAEERTYGAYANYLNTIKSKVRQEVYDSIYNDPAGDNYHYFRGSDYDTYHTSILDRYKYINNTEGNSPTSSGSGESYSTAYKTTPDAEDINQDYTMNEYENFYKYVVSLRPEDMAVGRNFIVDERKASVHLRNGNEETVTWYQFRIPVEEGTAVGSISDMSSIRFMRLYLTGFEEPVVLRFASFDLVGGEWRNYSKALYTGDKPSTSGTLETAAVNIEENNDKSPVNYVLPPGVTRVVDPNQPQLTQANEQALAITVKNLAPGDARAVYKDMNKDLRKYKHIQMFVHANALEGDQNLQNNQMSVFVRLGSDYKSNYYEYEIPLTLTPEGRYDTYTTAGCEAVWPEANMLDIDFDLLTQVKHARNVARANNQASYTQIYYEYDPDRPNNKVSVMGNPSLGEVKTMMIGVRNNSTATNSVEVWVNELRLKDYNNDGGYAAQGNLNVQLSDLGSVNLTGHVESAGFGGLEEGISSRRDDNLYEWSVTTNFDLGRLFPEKLKFSLPVYYSYSWQKVSPKYNPFDTDMLLKDALDECGTSAERDSLSNLTESIVRNKNFSLSNWKSNYQSRVPMPYDPANFSFSYSYSQQYKTGETTVYENDENWKFNMGYSYSPRYKALEPFKNIKGKSKWLDLIKAQNLSYLPQSIQFNTDITRSYYEFQERDIDAGTQLPVTWSQQFLWNRQFSLRWDIFKSLKLQYTSATHAEIEEPYTPVNKDLYPDAYDAWKDSVKTSLAHFGRPLTYSSSFNGSYTVPLSKIPVLDWMTLDGSYASTYGWNRGTEMEDGTSLGHTANTSRTVNINGKVNLETLYKKSKFLNEVNQRFSSNKKKTATNKKTTKTASKTTKDADGKDKTTDSKDKTADGKDSKDTKNSGNSAAQSKNKKKSFTKEYTLNDSTYTEVKHGQKTKRIIVKATTKEGRSYELKYKKVDENTIRVKNLDTAQVKITVTPKDPLDDKSWYRTLQSVTRVLMMVRNASFTYRNTYTMTLPGFKTEIGDAFGQKSVDGILSPGLDFAFGAVGNGYVDKAVRNGWLIQGDSNITTPVTTNATEDLQVRVTLEPLRDLKIDLNASRTVNRSRSVQFMYDGMPTTQSGSFNMTVITAKTAFSGSGNINNNYSSKPFNDFLANIPIMRERVQKRYENVVYPVGTGSGYEGKVYDPANGEVNQYSADVLVPAFLAAYTGGNASSGSLDIFPTVLKMMPNWKFTYSGLSKLAWFSQRFKSFNVNHAYKSVYAVGAYNSYANYMGYMDNLGFILDVTSGNPIPSSMYNISTVSITESFSPLIGVDMTFNSGMTAKLEYKKTRSLNLSLTSVALTENYSNDIVIGLGYKLKDLNLFGAKRIQSGQAKNKKKNSKDDSNSKTANTRVGGVSHDLNLRVDFSYRMQNALNRNIQTTVTTATNGSTAYKLAISADYTFSRLLTLSGYLDWQKNVPLVTTSSYPTTTADFGISCKFSLTR